MRNERQSESNRPWLGSAELNYSEQHRNTPHCSLILLWNRETCPLTKEMNASPLCLRVTHSTGQCTVRRHPLIWNTSTWQTQPHSQTMMVWGAMGTVPLTVMQRLCGEWTCLEQDLYVAVIGVLWYPQVTWQSTLWLDSNYTTRLTQSPWYQAHSWELVMGIGGQM